MTDHPYAIVFMTASNREEAEKIADALVAEGLAACVNMVESCKSVYKWKGEVVRESEVLLIAKTNRQRFAEIEKRVEELHSYEVPEIISVSLTDISAGYRDFLADLLGG